MWLFVPFGQIEAEVPEVLESDRLGILGELGLERGVTARAAATGNMVAALFVLGQREQRLGERPGAVDQALTDAVIGDDREAEALERAAERRSEPIRVARLIGEARSEEHTSELQSLMRISYAVFCLKKKKMNHTNNTK